MICVSYVIIGIIFFILLVYWNKRTNGLWDEVILAFYCVFSALWIAFLPMAIILFLAKKISKVIRND